MFYSIETVILILILLTETLIGNEEVNIRIYYVTLAL